MEFLLFSLVQSTIFDSNMNTILATRGGKFNVNKILFVSQVKKEN